MPYKVIVADNFHYMQADEESEHGVFQTADEAVSAAKRIVEADLAHIHKPGMSATALFDMYSMFGDDPYIRPTEGAPSVEFSAWDYAKIHAEKVAAERS